MTDIISERALIKAYADGILTTEEFINRFADSRTVSNEVWGLQERIRELESQVRTLESTIRIKDRVAETVKKIRRL